MLQVYSLNQTLTDGSYIPLNNIVIEKGRTAVLAAPATIQLNKAGVYMIHCNANVTGDAAGDGTIQLAKNGVGQAGAQSTETLVLNATSALSFEALVQVPFTNCDCCCVTSPTTIQILYSGVNATGDINVLVTKIC